MSTTPFAHVLTFSAHALTLLFAGYTPLHIAAATGQEQVISLLLQAGASVAAKSRQEEDCLLLAAAAGHEAALQQLLAAWQKAEAVWQTENKGALRRAFERAAEHGRWSAAGLLLGPMSAHDSEIVAELVQAVPGAELAMQAAIMASAEEQEDAALEAGTQQQGRLRRVLLQGIWDMGAVIKQLDKRDADGKPP
jgi:TPR repeat protein